MNRRLLTCCLVITGFLFFGVRCTNTDGAADATDGSDSEDESQDPSPTLLIDVHTHASVGSEASVLTELTDAMSTENVGAGIVMNTPSALVADAGTIESSSDLVSFFTTASAQFPVFYGGTELQPLLHAVGRTTAFTTENVFPNGTSDAEVAADLAEMTTIAADPETWETVFKERATAAATSGQYAGFGEIAPYHMSQRSGHPFITYPVGHEWLLWLSDLAAQYGLVLDVHVEATDETMSGLETLLSHNTDTKIIWDHAGWSNTGEADAALFTRMLADHPNLYLSVKLRTPDTDALSAGYPLNDDGTLKSEWESLFMTYSGRIMLGSDVKYWQEQNGETAAVSEVMTQVVDLFETLLGLLPEDVAYNLRRGTARELFSL